MKHYTKRFFSFLLTAAMLITMLPAVSISADNPVYYLSASGSDDNSGKNADAPLATLKAAMEALGTNEGTIKIIGSYSPTKTDYTSHTQNIDIVGYDDTSLFDSSLAAISFGGPVTFKNITYTRGTNSYILSRGHDITFGEGFKTTSTSDWMVFGGGQNNTSVNDINVTVMSGSFTGKFNVGAIMPKSTGFTVANDANVNVSGGSISNIILGSTNWGACGAVNFAKSVVVQHDGGTITKISATATGNGSPTAITGSLIVINNNGSAAPTYDTSLDSISIGAKYYVNSAEGGYVAPVTDSDGNAVAGKFLVTIEDDANEAAMIINGDSKTILSESGEVTLQTGTTEITYANYPPNPGTTIPMTWKSLDKGYITFCFDDNRTDLPTYVDIIMKEYNLPLCAAVPSGTLTRNNALLHEIQDRGGEILSHTKSHLVIKPFVTPWADVETQLGDSYRALTADGFNVNGIILAGGTGQIAQTDTEYRGLIELVTNKYYKYSDKYGLSTQYWKQRNWFSGRTLDQLKAIVDTHIANKSWEVIYGHGLEECSEETLRGLLEYIMEKKQAGLVDVVTYKYMHENFGDWESPVDFGDTTYTVDFYGTDGTTHLGKSVTVIGQNATAPEGLVTAEGYTFKGWSASLENVTNNYSVYAVCTDANGNTVGKDSENVVTPPPPPSVFYVDSTNGDDTYDGETPQTAVTSITKAVSLAQADKPFEVKIIGSYTLPTTIGGHTGMMTISGYDSTSEIATVKSGGYTFAGPVTVKDITFTNGLYAWASMCGHKLVLGENVTTSGNHQIVSSGNVKTATQPSPRIEIYSGTWNKIGMGPIAAQMVYEIPDDASTYIAGGTVNTVNIGGDGWSPSHLGVNFKSNVLLKVDGGTLKNVKIASDNYAPTFEGAIMAIFNNGIKPSDITAVEKATVPDGVYTVYSAQGGAVDFVYGDDGNAVAGKFNLSIDEGNYALVKSGDSETVVYESGTLTLSTGKTEITYKALSELETVIEVTDGDEKHLYYPADRITITNGGTIALPDGMKREGMLFGGWYSDSAYTKAVANGSAVADGTVLYARWIELGEKDLYVDGIQIRVTGISGLRFVSTISHDTRAMLASLHASNSILDPDSQNFNTGTGVGYGTVVVPTKTLGENELVKGGRYIYNEKVYLAKTVPARYTFGVEDTYDSFTAVITKIVESNYSQHYSARPYITYTDASGTTHTAYGSEYDASLYDVARLVYESGAQNEPEEDRESIMEYLYNNILIKNDGVENALANTYRALHNDKKLTVGYLGGSITNGSSASKLVNSDGTVSPEGGDITLSYVNRTTNWLKTQFCDAEIEFINAGVSDTATNYGVYRLEKHLMNEDGHDMPDLVFVEFTSNDWTYDDGIVQDNADLRRQIESLVRGIYSANPYADIVFVFTARSENSVSRKNYIEIAQHYGIPCIDMGIPMQALMTARGASNEASGTYYYTTDNLHPSTEGYGVYFEEIKKTLSPLLVDTAVYYADKKDKTANMPAQLCRSLWTNPAIIPASQFTVSGTTSAAGALTSGMYGTSMTQSSSVAITDSSVRFSGTDATAQFTFTGTSFGFIFGMNSSGFDIDYQIDDHGWKKAEIDEDLLSFQKYSHTQLIVFEQELAYGEHTVELKFNATSDGNVDVVIGGAAVCGEDNGLQKLVALSVDDGPRTTTTPMLLDELKKYGAHATFFCVGSNITDATAPVMQRIIAEGSEIGNHGNLWDAMSDMTAEELMADFNTVQTKAYNATGVYPKVFRAPGLKVSETLLKTLPIPVFGGKLGVSDWKGADEVSVQSRIDAIMANVVDGRIILTHDVAPNAEAYAVAIPKIYEMGYKIVTISELIKLRGYSAPAGSDDQYWEFP